MTKTLRDLIPIKMLADTETGRMDFVREGGITPIPAERITILKCEPVLLRELYGDCSLFSPYYIPEEANAFVKGKNLLCGMKSPEPLCPAYFCILEEKE